MRWDEVRFESRGSRCPWVVVVGKERVGGKGKERWPHEQWTHLDRPPGLHGLGAHTLREADDVPQRLRGLGHRGAPHRHEPLGDGDGESGPEASSRRPSLRGGAFAAQPGGQGHAGEGRGGGGRGGVCRGGFVGEEGGGQGQCEPLYGVVWRGWKRGDMSLWIYMKCDVLRKVGPPTKQGPDMWVSMGASIGA